MKIDEVIYCLKSYQSDAPDDMCYKCPYYGSIPNEDGIGYHCKANEARDIAIKMLSAIEDIKAELKSKVFSEDWVENVIYFDDCIEIIDKHMSWEDEE